MDGGGLVSDEIMVGIVDERLNESDTTKRGYILDGFPRTEAQAQALEKITADRPLDVVLNLEVPEDVVLERITKRRVCVTCGHIYSVDAPPKNGWICDVDGGEVVQRDDDTEEAVRKRLDLYAAETLPLVAVLRRARPAGRGRRPRARPTRSSTGCLGRRRLPPRRSEPCCSPAPPRSARPSRSPSCAGPAGSWPRCTSGSGRPSDPASPPATSTASAGRSSPTRGATSNFLGYHRRRSRA